MGAFTELELAALHSIFSETPELKAELECQLTFATVAKRENSGGGFFTEIAFDEVVPAASCATVLGHETHARVSGLEHGLGFVLFMEGGRLKLLEGYTVGAENTEGLDLVALKFEVFRETPQGIGAST